MQNAKQILTRGVASVKGLAVAVVLMTVLADQTFYRQPYGWLYGLFLLLAGLLLVVRPAPAARVPGVPLLVLALASGAIVYRGGVLAPLLAVLALVALAGARVAGAQRHAEEWVAAALRVPIRLVDGLQRDLRLLRRRGGRAREAGTPLVRVLLAWGVPLALGVVFLILFCLANPVIERGVDRAARAVADFLAWLELPEVIRILFWLLVAAGLWGFWRIRRGRVVRQAVPPPLPQPPRPPEGAPALVWRCLGLFNVLFALETATDLIYLWGGCALPEGMTYAAYAHRGAYPLVVTALLSAGLTLFFFPPGRRAERDPVARALVLAWLAQNILLTISAAWRLHLYVDVYTLTRLRLAALVWMGLVGFGLLAIAWRIARCRDTRWLVDVNAAALLVVLLGCAWWPMDRTIARHNVRYCREAGGPGRLLDIDYLRQLGPEAIPALRAYAQWPDAQQTAARAAADGLAEELRRELVNPRAWTLRRGLLAGAEVRVGEHER